METGVPAGLTPAEGRRFAWTLGGAFALLAAVSWWRGHGLIAVTAAGVSVLLFAAGVVAPGALGPVYRGWMRFGLALSRVTTPIIMAVIYFGILTPTGLAMRLFGRRPLEHCAHDGSYWQAPRSGGRSDLDHQF